MDDINQLSIVGRLTSDIEVKYGQSGSAYAHFNIAVNDGYGDKKHTSFFDVTVFGKTAENLAQYRHKGDQIVVSGSIKQDSWEHEGKKRYRVVIIARSIQYPSTGQKKHPSGQQSPQAKYNEEVKEAVDYAENDDDIPF